MINFRKETDPPNEEMCLNVPPGTRLRLKNVADLDECVLVKIEGELPAAQYMFWDPKENDCFFFGADEIARMNVRGEIEILQTSIVDEKELAHYEDVYRERVKKLLGDMK